MTFVLVAYEKLKGNLRESVKTLIKYYNPKADFDDSTKLEDMLQDVTAERRPQCLVLLKAIDLLDASKHPSESKARVLNALAYYVHQQIHAKYLHSSPTKSNFYNSLTTALGLSKENSPDNLDLPDMYSSLSKFLRAHVYVAGDPRKGYLPKEEQVFDFPDYEVTDDIKAIELKLSELRIVNIDDALKLHHKQQKPKADGGGLFAFWGGSAAKPEKPKSAHKKTRKHPVVVEEQVETTREEEHVEETVDTEHEESKVASL